MSYRLFATRPTLVQLGGKPRMLGAGDRLHLSEEDAQRILQSPAASYLTVVTSTDSSEAPNYADSEQYEVLPDFAEMREATPTCQDPFETPMPESAKVDPLEGTYNAYAADGEKLLGTLIQSTESTTTEETASPEEAKIAEYEETLRLALPAKANWRSIVAYLETFELRENKPTDFIIYIKDKYKGLATVVAKCNSLLGITEDEEQ